MIQWILQALMSMTHDHHSEIPATAFTPVSGPARCWACGSFVNERGGHRGHCGEGMTGIQRFAWAGLVARHKAGFDPRGDLPRLESDSLRSTVCVGQWGKW
mgnify:CR=1 FL=1